MDQNELLTFVKKIRRDLHEIPELGFDLPKTSHYVREVLVSLSYDPIPVAQTGWVVHIEGEVEEAVAFRADMDGLPVHEETNVDYLSKHPGRMHACGHDGHMAMLLGFAKLLKEMEKPYYSVVLLFQPAEEGPGGAKVVLNEGILQRLKVKRIYGFHLYPGLSEGTFGLCSGPFMARNGEFDVEILGKSAHAGLPQEGLDALLAGSAILNGVSEIRTKRIAPLSPGIIHIGKFTGGTARNIVAGSALLEGTIRAFDKGAYEEMKEGLRRLVDGIAYISSCKITLTIRDFYPEVRNSPRLVKEVCKLLKEEEYSILSPLMLAEDFSFYQEEIDGVFMFLGTGNDALGYSHSLHHESFNFREEVLLKGIALYEKILFR